MEQQWGAGRGALEEGAGRSAGEDNLDSKTVLVLFLGLALVFIYLVSLLLVVIRRAKRLIQLHNSRYYFFIAFYIFGKMAVCVALGVEVLMGVAGNYLDLTPAHIEAMVKTAIVLADLSVVELFLSSLQYYFQLSLSTLRDTLSRKQSRYIRLGLQTTQVLAAAALLIPLTLYGLSLLDYSILNGIGLGLNVLVLTSFLATFFYLNFKMTGVMMDPRINELIKRVYKLQLIILVSRFCMVAFELMVALFVPGSFQQALQGIHLQYEVVLAVLFTGSILFILFTEGLPVMYSLRSNVVQALNYKAAAADRKDTMFTGFKTDLESGLVEKLEDNILQEKQMRLKKFGKLVDLRADAEEAIWVSKKGKYEGQEYLIRISKHELSSYIFEDIENEITLWNELGLKSLSKLSYFCEGEIIHLVEKYYCTSLDSKIDNLPESGSLRIAIQLSEAINELHKNQIAHGSLTPAHIFYENGQIVLNGCGLHSMRKYLSLITGYSNKSMFSAVEYLKDKNNVILKPQKPADVYSFGILLYEIITKNRQYRQLSLKEVQARFGEENFRPKLPEETRGELKSLIRRCWHENAARRPDIQEVVDVLKRLV